MNYEIFKFSFEQKKEEEKNVKSRYYYLSFAFQCRKTRNKIKFTQKYIYISISHSVTN